MNQIPSLPPSYQILVISLNPVMDHVYQAWRYIAQNYHLQPEDIGIFYDWMVTHAANKVLAAKSPSMGIHIHNHYRHQVYEEIYTMYGSYIEQCVARQFSTIRIMPGAIEIKLMVSGSFATLAIGRHPTY